MRVIYRGEPMCKCIEKLEDWYSQDQTVIQHGAQVECDCGTMWDFFVEFDGSGWRWEMSPYM